MGMMLPKPVLSGVHERSGGPAFRVGAASVNGYRENMEDAHIAYMRQVAGGDISDWGFFGVFDGHVNDHCSKYLQEEWHSIVGANDFTMPITDERLKEMTLSVDKKYLDNDPTGGSTGTFFFAMKKKVGDKIEVQLQVGNVGDSRVLVSCNKQCMSMTTDHKPFDDNERERIVRCGGHVENGRVNGSLAIARAFGDADYKRGTGSQLEQQVIALPDVTRATVGFGNGDFAVLACDGVFEGQFSNEEVIEFVQAQFDKHGNDVDLALVSQRVCEESIHRNSKDNISCMIVQFRDGTGYGAEEGATGPITDTTEFVPGPLSAPTNGGFRKAYWGMASKGGATPEKCLEQRYDIVKAVIEALEKGDNAAINPADRSSAVVIPALDVEDDDATTVSPQELKAEMNIFEPGPPASAAKGSQERLDFFREIYNKVESMGSPSGGTSDAASTIMQLQRRGIPLAALMDAFASANAGGAGDDDE